PEMLLSRLPYESRRGPARLCRRYVQAAQTRRPYKHCRTRAKAGLNVVFESNDGQESFDPHPAASRLPLPGGRGNDLKTVPLPLGEGGAKRRVRVEGHHFARVPKYRVRYSSRDSHASCRAVTSI